MIASNNLLLNTHKNIDYIRAHNHVFDVEDFYHLDIFEKFAETNSAWSLECSAKIQKDKLHPARFNLFYNNPTTQHYHAVLDFFHQVESRIEVKLDYHLIQQFLGNNFDFSKAGKILVGVDLRRELADSRLKFWFIIDKYPEKLETAISLSGNSETLQLLLVNNPNSTTVGFDFHLDGRSGIEVYPTITPEDLQNLDVQARLAQVLPHQFGTYSMVVGH